MSLILGVWLNSLGTYQVLALKFAQQEAKRLQLRRTFDVYEIAEQVRVNGNQDRRPNSSEIYSRGLKNESSRMSGRTRSLRAITQSTPAN